MTAIAAAVATIAMMFGTPGLQDEVVRYGSTEDLKGVTRVFVYTGTETEVRENITKEIRKKLKDIQFVNSPGEAEVWLMFSADISTFRTGSTTRASVHDTALGTYGTAQTTDDYRTVVDGRGYIYRNRGGDDQVLVSKFGDTRTTAFERRPSTNFAKAFVKMYQEANKEERR